MPKKPKERLYEWNTIGNKWVEKDVTATGQCVCKLNAVDGHLYAATKALPLSRRAARERKKG